MIFFESFVGSFRGRCGVFRGWFFIIEEESRVSTNIVVVYLLGLGREVVVRRGGNKYECKFNFMYIFLVFVVY